ncbi:MAG: polysaccharide deacetylase family protein [Acidimicrobiia bacterium]
MNGPLERPATPDAAARLRGVARRMGLRRPRREHLAALRLAAERHLLPAVRRPGPRRSRILCYHSVGTPEWGVNDIAPERFEHHLRDALELGYRFRPARELADGAVDDRSLAITFDDGVHTVLTAAAPILADLGIPWSVFVVTEWADGRHPYLPADRFLDWADVRRLAEIGVTIGSHSVSHPDCATLSSADLTRELADSRARIEQQTGRAVDEFAIPVGQSANWPADATRLAHEVGYSAVYAQSELRRPPGTIPRTFVTRTDSTRVFRAALAGVFDSWEEWY